MTSGFIFCFILFILALYGLVFKLSYNELKKHFAHWKGIYNSDDKMVENLQALQPYILKTLEQIDALGKGLPDRKRGTLFEKEVVGLYNTKIGCKAYLSEDWRALNGHKRIGQDGGGDVVLEEIDDKGITTRSVIQCKLYSNPVGTDALEEAIFAMDSYKASKAIVITNNIFTKPALDSRDERNANNGREVLVLIDRSRLGLMLADAEKAKADAANVQNAA